TQRQPISRSTPPMSSPRNGVENCMHHCAGAATARKAATISRVIIALAVTRDGMAVRSWVLPGDTADVTTVARIKDDLRAWTLGRCVFVGDAGMYSADNLAQLSRGLGRYILAVPMRRVRDIGTEVLTRPGRYKQVADNLLVKEVWVGDGERRKRYVLCLNPHEAERERTRRAQLLIELNAELALLEQRQEDHPKAAC